jgi:hypothetical protein
MHGHVQTDQVNFCACTHVQNGFPDNLKWHARYFMDAISSTPMRGNSSTKLFLLLHIASNSSAHCTKIEVMYIILQHILFQCFSLIFQYYLSAIEKIFSLLFSILLIFSIDTEFVSMSRNGITMTGAFVGIPVDEADQWRADLALW